ncbi:hypothetical protein F7725_000034 [Dissostichus mawsoni]|uniref:Uncharacterized protein n=1 Tax=Dissostichus mawsoni TaxID=36200 RepID=A0A7J5ZLN3_DISMA|nr:hypothetical protein F7725_000034 [Dissostichus mawsoni]
MYWCAVSTPSGQGAQIVANGSRLCLMYRTYTQAMETYSRHASMAGWRGGSPTRNGWNHAAVKLETLVCNKTLCKDISKLSGGCQTSSVEGFHSLLIQFAPKMILIAALHYNENANRVQDVTKTGEARFSINYPKGRKGAAVLRRVLESPTYEYAQELLEEIVKECTDKENVDAEKLFQDTGKYAQELLEEIVKECTDKENVDAEFAVEPNMPKNSWRK